MLNVECESCARHFFPDCPLVTRVSHVLGE